MTARFKRHIRDAKNGSPVVFHRAIRKYGHISFSFTCLEEVEGSSIDLRAAEIRHIAQQQSTVPNGYNLTYGGEGFAFATQELKQRMKDLTRRVQQTPEYRVAYLAGIARREADPDLKQERLAVMSTEYWKEAQREGARKRSADPAWQQAHDEVMRKLYADPEWRARHDKAMKLLVADPTWLEINRKTLAATIKTDSWKIAHLAGVRRRTQDTEWKKAQKEGCQRRSSDPAWLLANAKHMQDMRILAAEKQVSDLKKRDASLSPDVLARRLRQRGYDKKRRQKDKEKRVASVSGDKK